jgi:hypothetical protein
MQAIGDNLISLSIFSKVDRNISVLGTSHTKNIAQLMGVESKFDIHVIFDDIPAFYNVKKCGVINAIFSILEFRRYIKCHNLNELVFEKSDFRVKLLTVGLNVKSYSVDRCSNVYENRKYLAESVFGGQVNFANKPTNLFPDHGEVLISPVTRLQSKNIYPEHLTSIIDIFKSLNFTVRLIDYSGNYYQFNDVVDQYITGTTLDDVMSLILSTDIYIGADSFLIHLSYYLNKPHFTVFNHESSLFLTPPSLELNNYIVTSDVANFFDVFYSKLKALGVIR